MSVHRWLAYTYECLLQNLKPASKARTTRRNTFTSQDALYDIDRLVYAGFYGTAYLASASKVAPSLDFQACQDSASAAYCGYWLLQGPAWHARLCEMAGVYGDTSHSLSRLTSLSARSILQGLLTNPPGYHSQWLIAKTQTSASWRQTLLQAVQQEHGDAWNLLGASTPEGVTRLSNLFDSLIPPGEDAQVRANSFLACWASPLKDWFTLALTVAQPQTQVQSTLEHIANHSCMQRAYPTKAHALLALLQTVQPYMNDYYWARLQPLQQELTDQVQLQQSLAQSSALTALYDSACQTQAAPQRQTRHLRR